MELKSLQEIFNEKFFRIPIYQRGYSWDENNLRDLWRDIDNLKGDKYHYTGMLSVVEQKDHVSVVDGQQRIATLIILIHVICSCKQVDGKKRINGKEKIDYVKKYLHIKIGRQGRITESIFGYSKDNPSHVCFKKAILCLGDMKSSIPRNTLYTHKLKKAKEFFEGKIKNMSFDELETLLSKITEKFKFNYYIIDSELNEFVAFETMNNRGKLLSSLELLKNRLMYLSTLFENNDAKEKRKLRQDINEAWKTVYEYLGKNPNKTINDDDFLKDHWIMNFPYTKKKSKAYRIFLLNEHFTAERVLSGQIKYEEISNYADDIQQAVKAYYYMHNPDYSESGYSESGYSEEIKTWVSKLKRLGFGAFKPLITSILTHLANENIEEEQSIEILKFIERFLFVAFNVGCYRSNYKDYNIYRWAHTYHKDQSISEMSEISALQSDYKKYEFYAEVYRKYDGFYKWQGLKYFLYEYELHLEKEANGESKVGWEHVNDETIEHIFPQSPRIGEWDNFGNQDLVHDLGNLLLLSSVTNSELSNRPFLVKKEEYRKGSYSAIKVVEYDDWTPKSIKDREGKMLCFMEDRWELKKS